MVFHGSVARREGSEIFAEHIALEVHVRNLRAVILAEKVALLKNFDHVRRSRRVELEDVLIFKKTNTHVVYSPFGYGNFVGSIMP